jgi:hypothetical protein
LVPLGDAGRGDPSERGGTLSRDGDLSAVVLLAQRGVGRLEASPSFWRPITSSVRRADGRQGVEDGFNPGDDEADPLACSLRCARLSSISRSRCLCFSKISSCFLDSS